MGKLSGSELLLYGGIGLMILVIILAIGNLIFIRSRREKLKKRLIGEYGEPIDDLE